MRRQTPKLNAAGGFTLLELMIVLFLAVLITGMGIIAMMSRLPAARLDATVREISAMMRQARTLARIHMVKQTLVVDLDAGRYGIDGRPARKIPEKVRLTIDDPLTGDTDQGIHRLIFSPFGGIDGGAMMLTADQRHISIKPDPVTGFLISRRNRD
ncbi:MAG: hypothetical protein AB1558_00970 [Thermodesulfobacteriota bacterium]